MDLNQIGEILSKEIPYVSLTVGNIVYAIVAVLVGYILSILVSRYIRRIILKAKMTQILADFSSRVIKILIIIFSVAVGIGFLGVDVGAAVISVSVVGGFIFGFAFQDTMGNLAAGFMIAITRPFKAKDYVDVAGQSGIILSVGASITKLTTVDNKRVIIPNSKVWGEPIVNYTSLKQRMLDLTVGISYSDDMTKAIKIVMDVLKNNKKVLKDPLPNVAIRDLGSSSVDLVVRPWVNTGDYWNAKWEITKEIKEAFDKNNISIPFPQTDVHLFQHK